MAEPSTHINYSFEDIQRYLQGKMSAAEMHIIEKAALQDPFLADAIEGLNEANLTTVQQHLNEINTALLKEKKESKIVAFNKKTQWMNVAAVIIILAGIGVVAFYFLQSSNKQIQVAQVTKAKVDDKKTEQPAFKKLNGSPSFTDTVFYNKNKTLTEPNVAKNKKGSGDLISTDEDSKEIEITSSDIATSPPQKKINSMPYASASLSNQSTDSVPDILPRRISGISIAPTIFAGKVTDENNQPVAGAIVEATDKSITVLTDNSGNFRLFKSDTMLNATAGTIGYENKTIALQPGDSNVIILKQNNTALNEVVVVGYNSKKLKPVSQTATPVGGWENFNNYVLSKLNKDSTNNDFMTANDEVEIEFLVDDQGNPYNIKVTKPLDKQRNSKAIEILKDGPKWTNASKTKKAKVAISF